MAEKPKPWSKNTPDKMPIIREGITLRIVKAKIMEIKGGNKLSQVPCTIDGFFF